jgi:hypothetical protein
MLAVLIAPITAQPAGSCSLSGSNGETYRINRRWGLNERIQDAEKACGCKTKDLDALVPKTPPVTLESEESIHDLPSASYLPPARNITAHSDGKDCS